VGLAEELLTYRGMVDVRFDTAKPNCVRGRKRNPFDRPMIVVREIVADMRPHHCPTCWLQYESEEKAEKCCNTELVFGRYIQAAHDMWIRELVYDGEKPADIEHAALANGITKVDARKAIYHWRSRLMKERNIRTHAHLNEWAARRRKELEAEGDLSPHPAG